MKTRGIVFDFNGTLFWDTREHNEAWFAFCGRLGVPLTQEIMFTRYHGKNNEQIFDLMFDGQRTPEQVRDYGWQKEAIYQEICLKKGMSLAPGAERFLNMLKTRNVPINVATASGRQNVDFYYTHLGLETWFPLDRIVYNDGTLPGKPRPEMYLRAMEILGLKPEETTIFEDSATGITAAENAHVGQIVIVDSNGDDYSRWPHRVIHSFDEVFDEWNV
ncbi:MAG: HAD family phosphatase [Planctomycetia bacterium]|nr:HAD family phosphatase [Planctomycetia bacterium]